jgi:polyisoprenoid-binding protein YceI
VDCGPHACYIVAIASNQEINVTAITNIPATSSWTVDKVHSSVGFSVKHMVVQTFRGTFEDYDATLTAAEDGTLHLAGTVKVGSVNVKDDNLKGHLLSPDFFDAESHPDITFDSTLVQVADGKLDVEGSLTIKGVTKPIKATGELNGPTETLGGVVKVGVTLEAEVDRRDYGLNWQATLPAGGLALGHEVKLVAEIEFVQA